MSQNHLRGSVTQSVIFANVSQNWLCTVPIHYIVIRYPQKMVQMAFCDLQLAKYITNRLQCFPACFCHPTVGNSDISPKLFNMAVISRQIQMKSKITIPLQWPWQFHVNLKNLIVPALVFVMYKPQLQLQGMSCMFFFWNHYRGNPSVFLTKYIFMKKQQEWIDAAGFGENDARFGEWFLAWRWETYAHHHTSSMRLTGSVNSIKGQVSYKI